MGIGSGGNGASDAASLGRQGSPEAAEAFSIGEDFDLSEGASDAASLGQQGMGEGSSPEEREATSTGRDDDLVEGGGEGGEPGFFESLFSVGPVEAALRLGAFAATGGLSEAAKLGVGLVAGKLGESIDTRYNNPTFSIDAALGTKGQVDLGVQADRAAAASFSGVDVDAARPDPGGGIESDTTEAARSGGARPASVEVEELAPVGDDRLIGSSGDDRLLDPDFPGGDEGGGNEDGGDPTPAEAATNVVPLVQPTEETTVAETTAAPAPRRFIPAVRRTFLDDAEDEANARRSLVG